MRIVHVQIASRAYPVYVGAAAREQIADLVRAQAGASQVAVIADAAVAEKLWPVLRPSFQTEPILLTFPPGESSKSLETASMLYDQLAEARLGRRDLIVTFGGGVAGDLGGFVAATWLRGVRYIQIATTLEAAIDASVGGKTAVNHRSAKNLIGAFHQPAAVIIDIDFLATLPQRELAAGLAESVKHSCVRDPAFLGWHEANVDAIVTRQPAALMELISRNCEIKAEIVGRDEREDDLRAVLNHGHTIGHAIEHVLGYQLRHGEAVGLGMIVENEIACRRGMLGEPDAQRIRALLERFGLPVRLPRAVLAGQVLSACRLDKKTQSGAIHFMLLRKLGQPERVSDVSEAEIEAALACV